MQKEIFTELFEEPTNNFQKHLEDDENQRIVFSGIYGIGKTTFLNHFFNKSNHKEEYVAIHLFPVNYSVLGNEDILSFIKHDILFELLDKKLVTFEDNDFTFLETAPLFVRYNAYQILALSLLLIPKLGRQLHKLSEEVLEMSKKAEKYNAEINENEITPILKFINEKHNTEGGLYENNIISQIISSKIDKLKESRKKVVLIIDDLDRIDPNHIFRLFNAFAAHFDKRDELDNKFGFDKVVFVCDINNVRNIFSNNYGTATDFNGYIDKFYSKEVYHFDNSNGVFSIFNKIIESIEIKSDDYKLNETTTHFNTDIKYDLRLILEDFIATYAINLRAFLKYYNSTINISDKLHIRFNGHRLSYNNLYYIIVLEILVKIVGDFDGLSKAIKKVINTEFKREYIDKEKYRVRNLVFVLDLLENGNITRDSNDYYSYFDQTVNAKFKYKIEEDRGSVINVIELKNVTDSSEFYPNYYDLIFRISNILNKRNML